MLNEREDNYEGQEDSEYHFSDDDGVSYEVEPPEHPQKPSPDKENFLNRLTRSKRMIISIVVFLILVFTVYKMVAPTNTPEANTTIAAAPAVVQPPVTAAAPTATPTPNTAATGVIAVNSPVANVQPPTPQASVQVPATSVAMPVQPQVVQPVQQPVQQPIQQIAPPVQAPSVVTTATTQTTTTPIGAPVTPTQSMPAQTTTTTTVTNNAQQPTATTQVTPEMSASLSAESEKLAAQLQNEYQQQINDYAAQNKALQDQVQVLNARVAGMETQMNQLVQALTRQNQAQQSPEAAPAPAVPVSGADAHVAYNVQAIIPGRAWLRSDNGETLTVAEGDVIRDLGRITKIDPYDGIVEINTGSKTISLSYGNGG